MKRSLLLFLLPLLSVSLWSQQLTLEREVNFAFITNSLGEVGSSDVWGWEASDGTEYAIIGNYNSVAFVRASDGLICDSIPAADQNDGYYHRDMVTYGNYAYCVSEMLGTNEGLMIFDLSPLPDSVRFVGSWTDNGNIVRSHNLDVDTAAGYLYIESDGTQGIDIVSIADPESPVRSGFISAPGIHDIHARNDTLWTAEGTSRQFRVFDVADKGNPILLGSVFDNTFGYCHNVWPSDDGRFFVTTEETANKSVKIWDASDMGNIQLRGTYLATNGLAHNVHVRGDYIYISHYTSGVTVVDWSDPDNPVEVAAYDTYPQNNVANFFGNWGATLPTPQGRVYASNFEGKLFILQWDPLAISVDTPVLLGQAAAYPNPFRGVVHIPLELDHSSPVTVQVYDAQGRLVTNLFSGELQAGRSILPWRSSSELAKGMYVIEARIGETRHSWRVVRE